MCIIIDTCAFSRVFNPEDENSNKFKPIKDWIIENDGKIVLGGSEYDRQLKRSNKYRKMFIEFRRAEKVLTINGKMVDVEHGKLKKVKECRGCDDLHIIAIVIVSNCRLICTEERKANKYFTMKKLYPKDVKVPKIFKGKKKHQELIRKHKYQKIRNII